MAGVGYGKPVTYSVGAELVCADWRDDNECGGGLHLSPTAHQATSYHSSATRWMRCVTPVAELRPIVDSDTAKCKVRTLRVVAEVDAFDRDITNS